MYFFENEQKENKKGKSFFFVLYSVNINTKNEQFFFFVQFDRFVDLKWHRDYHPQLILHYIPVILRC